jgi:hypothetical protein
LFLSKCSTIKQLHGPVQHRASPVELPLPDLMEEFHHFWYEGHPQKLIAHVCDVIHSSLSSPASICTTPSSHGAVPHSIIIGPDSLSHALSRMSCTTGPGCKVARAMLLPPLYEEVGVRGYPPNPIWVKRPILNSKCSCVRQIRSRMALLATGGA